MRLPLLPACGAPHPCCRTSGWGLRAGRSECQGLLYPKYQYPTLLSGSGSSVHITPTSEIDQRPRITYSYGLRPTTLYVYLSWTFTYTVRVTWMNLPTADVVASNRTRAVSGYCGGGVTSTQKPATGQTTHDAQRTTYNPQCGTYPTDGTYYV